LRLVTEIREIFAGVLISWFSWVPLIYELKQRKINILNGITAGEVPISQHKKHECIIFQFVLGQPVKKRRHNNIPSCKYVMKPSSSNPSKIYF
jgi:hypothetical protein